MSFVEFHDVSKIYTMGENKIYAADKVNFTIEQGEFCVIVGPSGAGKTTVLNMLGGMDTVTEGKILVDGAEISSFNERQLTDYRRYDVGFVFQFYNLIQNLTAKENVEIASEICRKPLGAEETLRNVGLAERMDNFPAQLSGGEQQRVSIARAHRQKPQTAAVRRADGRARLRDGQEHPQTLAERLPRERQDGHRHHAQPGDHADGGPRHPHQERQSFLRRGAGEPCGRVRHRMVTETSGRCRHEKIQ